MRDGLVENSWLENLEMKCECMEKVERRPRRNYTKNSVKKIPGLQIFGYFCKICSKHFGFYAKGIVPDCPIKPNPFKLTDEEKALDPKIYEAKINKMKRDVEDAIVKYRNELREDHQILAEPMGSWLGILEWEGMKEDWHQWSHKKTSQMIPIFGGHITLKEINEVINPGKIIGERLNESGIIVLDEGELIYPFRIFSRLYRRYQFIGLAEEWQN